MRYGVETISINEERYPRVPKPRVVDVRLVEVTSPPPLKADTLDIYPIVPKPWIALTNAAVLRYDRLKSCEPSPIKAFENVLPVVVTGPSTYKVPPKIWKVPYGMRASNAIL